MNILEGIVLGALMSISILGLGLLLTRPKELWVITLLKLKPKHPVKKEIKC